MRLTGEWQARTRASARTGAGAQVRRREGARAPWLGKLAVPGGQWPVPGGFCKWRLVMGRWRWSASGRLAGQYNNGTDRGGWQRAS